MMGAMTAVGTASGTRAWIGNKFGGRIGPVAMRRLTVALFAAAVLVSGLAFHGSAAAPAKDHQLAAARIAR